MMSKDNKNSRNQQFIQKELIESFVHTRPEPENSAPKSRPSKTQNDIHQNQNNHQQNNTSNSTD
jgi:hypothetical protein